MPMLNFNGQLHVIHPNPKADTSTNLESTRSKNSV